MIHDASSLCKGRRSQTTDGRFAAYSRNVLAKRPKIKSGYLEPAIHSTKLVYENQLKFDFRSFVLLVGDAALFLILLAQ